jgi:adenine-specific DNA-methyltransferase
MRSSIKLSTVKQVVKAQESVHVDLLRDQDPGKTISSGKIMIKAWAISLDIDSRQRQVQSFMYELMKSYWTVAHASIKSVKPLPALFVPLQKIQLDRSVLAVAEIMGKAAANFEVIEANHLLGNVYTSLITQEYRSANGVFYTPPLLASRLIESAQKAGVNWSTARVLDPACGSGVFLLQVARKIRKELVGVTSTELLEGLQQRLKGMELDPFGGWLSQVFIEIEFRKEILEVKFICKPFVSIGNSLETNIKPEIQKYDLVIGNPPYGKLKLTDQLRQRFKGSLYGHPNLYGLFTHLSIDFLAEDGVLAFLTPTSFLSGEYFKNLRSYLRNLVYPLNLDFVKVRKGVFEDVLQETILSTYKLGEDLKQAVKVNQISIVGENNLLIETAGSFHLPVLDTAPWMVPRTPEQSKYVVQMEKMTGSLSLWGYKVSTGPLVWNRHKNQLKNTAHGAYPIVWAESVAADGQFKLKCEKRNHVPYLKFLPGDEWLVTTKSCILLQRTTSKEQDKRLIAAALPQELIEKYKGIVVENHLNMILPIKDKPAVDPQTLSVFLNSRAVNDAFRTISGSVAVSAYELESLPLPLPIKLKKLTALVAQGESDKYEQECYRLYQIKH